MRAAPQSMFLQRRDRPAAPLASAVAQSATHPRAGAVDAHHRLRRHRRRRRRESDAGRRHARGRCSPGSRQAAAGPSSRSPRLLRESPAAVGSAATITDAVLAIAEAGADALAVTSDGSANGRLHRARDVGRHRTRVRRSADRNPARHSSGLDDRRAPRAQSPRPRAGPAVPDERLIGRLARPVSLAGRQAHRAAPDRTGGR